MKGPKFGIDTYLTFVVFSKNIDLELRSFELFVKMTNSGTLDLLLSGITSEDVIKIKQHLILSCVSRLMVSIESFIIMCYAISKGYHEIPKLLTYYDFNTVDAAITKIKSHKIGNVPKILGLPKISTLNLSKKDQRVLWCRYTKSVNEFYKFLNRMVDLYEEFRIIYGKSKHGLAIMHGGYLDKKLSKDLENSYLVVFDRKPKSKMPNSTFFLKKNKKLKIDSKWFHTQSVMKFHSDLMNKINNSFKDLRKYTIYISRNHLLYAKNCGQDYLPYDDESVTKEFGYFPENKLTKKEREVISKLVSSVVPNTNFEKKGIQYDLTVSRKRLLKSLKNDMTTHMFIE